MMTPDGNNGALPPLLLLPDLKMPHNSLLNSSIADQDDGHATTHSRSRSCAGRRPLSRASPPAAFFWQQVVAKTAPAHSPPSSGRGSSSSGLDGHRGLVRHSRGGSRRRHGGGVRGGDGRAGGRRLVSGRTGDDSGRGNHLIARAVGHQARADTAQLPQVGTSFSRAGKRTHRMRQTHTNREASAAAAGGHDRHRVCPRTPSA